jgi:hypothetical protein
MSDREFTDITAEVDAFLADSKLAAEVGHARRCDYPLCEEVGTPSENNPLMAYCFEHFVEVQKNRRDLIRALESRHKDLMKRTKKSATVKAKHNYL